MVSLLWAHRSLRGPSVSQATGPSQWEVLLCTLQPIPKILENKATRFFTSELPSSLHLPLSLPQSQLRWWNSDITTAWCIMWERESGWRRRKLCIWVCLWVAGEEGEVNRCRCATEVSLGRAASLHINPKATFLPPVNLRLSHKRQFPVPPAFPRDSSAAALPADTNPPPGTLRALLLGLFFCITRTLSGLV